LARNIAKKRDINDHSFAHLTLILLLHYLVKGRSRILDVYNNEFMLVPHAGSENHCETRKSLKICYFFNINQEQVYCTEISDIDELKRRINSEWAAVSCTD